MSSNEIRDYLHKYIDVADERFIATMYEISLMNKKNLKDKVYFKSGNPISKDQLYKELKEAEAEIILQAIYKARTEGDFKESRLFNKRWSYILQSVRGRRGRG